jgi:xylulokinase
MGGVGVGLFGSIPEGCDSMVQMDNEYIPDKKNAALYQDLYGVFCKLYEGLAENQVFTELARIQDQ